MHGNGPSHGSYNILRRFALDAFPHGIAECRLRPISVRLPDRRQDRSKQQVRRKASA